MILLRRSWGKYCEQSKFEEKRALKWNLLREFIVRYEEKNTFKIVMIFYIDIT